MNNEKLSLLSMMPGNEQEVPITGKKFFARYQGDKEITTIPVIINPEQEGVDVGRFRSFKGMGEAAVDHDGSPMAYAPDDKGSDKLKNGYDGKGNPVGFLPDVMNSEGGFVSTTGWEKSKSEEAAARQENYVDSRRIPYMVMPNKYFDDGGKMGDFVRLRNKINGKETWAVVADNRVNFAEGTGKKKRH